MRPCKSRKSSADRLGTTTMIPEGSYFHFAFRNSLEMIAIGNGLHTIVCDAKCNTEQIVSFCNTIQKNKKVLQNETNRNVARSAVVGK